MAKLCEICGQLPAAFPDRNRIGRPIKRICVKCHALRLRGDLQAIMNLRAARAALAEKEKTDA